ncbi:heparinase II/III family protein [Arenibacter echinorum]|uniref:Heparinase II/III-like protein n=1 Tax=Arenibacter echinorum TaxID=440515 RepID=A0A327QS68_9FLAO|nr:heparinase II/III family protein [Arenibacter echinorum]RAJ07131.1 heparinase II/III-like protein [Arenibacter echinorum]
MIQKLRLLFNTIKHMRFKQMYYQVYYKLRNRLYHKKYADQFPETTSLAWDTPLLYQNSWQDNNRFIFLNLEKSFEVIDWNFSEYGKLWTYNLNYFEFLNQKRISKEDGLVLIKDFIEKKDSLKDALEPYPLSLRGINWVKFLSKNKIQDTDINTFLFNDYLRLVDNLEYHLLGNHLLENGFSLLFGAVYFKNEKYYQKGAKILKSELNEQILNDGAHFELSPMYHQIILHRILDSVQLLKLNSWKQDGLLDYLKTKAEGMLGWLQTITYENGDIPLVNDAARGIAPSSKELFTYANYLGLEWTKTVLKESGYRKWYYNFLEFIIDIGKIGPDYIPAHANADSLQFLLQYKNKPIIVDTGISTYEKNERRQVERSTSSHNTVTINDLNSSEVWSGFRVARRAKVTILKDEVDSIIASHNGFQNLGIVHERCFERINNTLIIKDNLFDIPIGCEAMGHLHFHPSTKLDLKNNILNVDQLIEIEFLKTVNIKLSDYFFAEGFNKLIPAKKILFGINGFSEIKINLLKH